MSNDLISQLREYGEYHRRHQPPIDVTSPPFERPEHSLAPGTDQRSANGDTPVSAVRRSPVNGTGAVRLLDPLPTRRRGRAGPVIARVAAVAVVASVGGALAVAVADGDVENAGLVSSDASDRDSGPSPASVPPTEPEVTQSTDVALEPDASDEPESSPAPDPEEVPTASASPAAGATLVVSSDPTQIDASGAAATGGTPLPDIEGAIAGDDGSGPAPLGVIDTLPANERMDFLFEFCGWYGPGCFRDAHVMDPNDPTIGSGVFTAGRPFHIRHGFVNDGPDPLDSGFDLAVYVTPLDVPGESGGTPIGTTVRYTSDYVVRGVTDRCGPQYRSQTEPVSCEWFVHDFADGLPEGRHAIWAMWEAPCRAWLEWGFTDSCDNPDTVSSMFTSGYDGPYGHFEPDFTERDDFPGESGA